MVTEMKDLQEIVSKVKDVENDVNNLIVPLLKDTIADSNRHNHRLFILSVILSISLLIVAIFSQILVAYQNQKYTDFLSQFEFETEETTYMQDLDTNDGGNAVINSGITVTK